MGEHGQGKLSPRLEQRLEGMDATEPLEVIVELQPVSLPSTGTRQERIEAAKGGFERDLDTIAAVVAEAGGRVLESAWLNRTLRALIPPDGLDRVVANELVQAIDLPRPLEPDAQPPEPDAQEARTNPAP